MDRKIYIMGDSHVNIFCKNNNIPFEYPDKEEHGNFEIYRVGAPLAYNLIKDETLYKAKQKIKSIIESVKGECIYILSFGEIDCRYHITNQSKKTGLSFDKIIDNCVDRYIWGVQDIFNNSGKKVWLYGPPASTWITEDFSSRDMPICGSEFQRNLITALFNKLLKSKCENLKNIKCFTIFDYLINEDYTTKRRYYMDNIHLNSLCLSFLMNEMESIKWNQ
jgi:hypothetical protein